MHSPSSHKVLDPHGEGLQGSGINGGAKNKFCYLHCKDQQTNFTFYRFWFAMSKRITKVPFQTAAYRSMIYDTALCIQPTRSRTRICALLTNACQITRAVGIDATFRSTVWWTAFVSRNTRACWITTNVLTNRVCTTRRVDTRI